VIPGFVATPVGAEYNLPPYVRENQHLSFSLPRQHAMRTAPMAVSDLPRPGPETGRRIHLLGTAVDAVTMRDAVERVEHAVATRVQLRHVAMNAAKLVEMRRNPILRESVESADLITADGQSLIWAARLLGTPLPERVTGIDLMEQVLHLAARRGLRVFTLGAREDVVRDAVQILRTRHPGLNIVGAVDGYFTPEEEAAVVAKVAAAAPDILFVALSTPKKELFLANHQDRLGIPFCMGVGGSLDVIAGRVRRAPALLQRAGLEWMFRLAQEPRRLWRRYLRTNTAFLWLLLRARWENRRAGRARKEEPRLPRG